MTASESGVIFEEELEVDGRVARLTVATTGPRVTYSVLAMENVEGPLRQYAMAMDHSDLWRLRHMVDNALFEIARVEHELA